MAKAKNIKLKVSTPLFYTDSGELMGEITKVLKRDVHVKLPDGSIRTNFPQRMAIKMLK